MRTMKDLFSEDSLLYRKARPTYPSDIILEILKYVSSTQFAWDCGAGSGQFTQLMAPYFEQIVATDLSAQQLHQAPYFENVSYQVQSAEKTTFADQSFDLITVAQAIHWFDFDAFYREVKRTLKKDGVFAVIGYGTPVFKEEALQLALSHLYELRLKEYWDAERKYIDEEYKTIPFPFEIISDQHFSMQYTWSKAQILGYLNTWSAIKHFHQKNSGQSASDPLDVITACLEQYDDEIVIEFPIFLKMGKIKKSAKARHSMGKKVQIHKMFNLEMLKFC